jgi:hypothetical protein
MSAEEERLSWLLKNAVPQPPVEVTADQVTSRRPVDRSVKSWLLPALAAAAVVAIGVTIGVVAQRGPGPARPTGLGTTGTSGASASTSSRPSASTSQPSASTSPQPAVNCPGGTVVVPNVIGTTFDAASAILQDVGLVAGSYDAVPPASEAVPVGMVFAQTLPAGSKAVPGTGIWLGIAVASPIPVSHLDPGFGPATAPPPSATFCSGPAATTPPPDWNAPVPSVIGMTQAQAVAIAEAAGFNVSVTHAAPPTGQHVPPGTVFAQLPAPGSTTQPGSGMILFATPAT